MVQINFKIDSIIQGASAQLGNYLMEEMLKQKSLPLNIEKSAFLIMGNKKVRKKIKEEVEINHITLIGKIMIEVTSLKYLGDFVGSNLEESVEITVQIGQHDS